MKKSFSLVLLLVSIQCAFGQLKYPKTNAYFASAMFGMGTHASYGILLQHQNKKGFSASIAATVESRMANTPKDYSCFICFPGMGAGNHLRTIIALVGKVWQPKLAFIRYQLSAGVAVGSFSRSKNFKRTSSSGKYLYEQETKFTGGIVARSTLQLSLLPFWGYYIGARAHLNPYDPTLIFEFGMTLGLLRNPINYVSYRTPAVPYRNW